MNKIKQFQPDYSSYAWEIYDLGMMAYEEALELQQNLRDDVIDGGDHKILLLEHPPVITLGRRTNPDHLLKTKEELHNDGIELFRVDRGGSATYHGPGQLVGYFICRSSRVGGIHELVARILQSIQQTLHKWNINCRVDSENPGIWTESEIPRKLAAVGLSNSQGYTMHGFAINVDLPLNGFSAIVPCGLTLPVSTMAIETGTNINVQDVKQEIIDTLIDELSKPIDQLRI